MNNMVMFNLDDLKEAINQVLDERGNAVSKAESQKDEFVTRKELCKLIGVSNVTLWRMEKEGRIIPTKIGKKSVYNKAEVVALIKDGKLSKYNR